MKFRILIPLISVTAFVASGCGQKNASDAAPASAPPAATAATPATPAGPRVVEITAGDTMKYSITSIEAKAGEEIKISLTNIGNMPKEAMAHNWVLLKKGTDAGAFATAAMMAKETDYIPPSMKDQIIAHTDLIGPRKSSEVTFKAPAEAGEYPFLCSYPAHYLTGMKGVLVVK